VARPGITYLDVAKAATQLMEQNTRPSIEAIRRILGTGSNSTINRYLRDWRDKQGNQVELEQGLPESLLIAVKGIYEAIKEDAAQKIKKTETTSSEKVADLERQLAIVAEKNQQLEQEKYLMEQASDQIHAEYSALERKFNDVQRALDKKTDENQLMQARLDETKTDINRMDQQLKHSQNSVDHYRESVRRERETERNKLEEKINRLEYESKQQQKLTPELREKNASLAGQIKLLESDKQATAKELNTLMQRFNEQSNKFESQKSKLIMLEEQHRALHNEKEQLATQATSDKKTIAALQLKLENADGRIAVLNNGTKRLEDNLENFSNKALFLTQEKTELAMQLSRLQETIS
jgi:chromosome segregation ATPase